MHVTEQGGRGPVWKRGAGGGYGRGAAGRRGPGSLVPDARVRVSWSITPCGTRPAADRVGGTGQRAAAPERTPDTARLYQVRLTVTALDGNRAIFAGHNDPELSSPPAATMIELQHLALLHRRDREYAHGRQCAVDAEVRDGEDRAWRLATTCFPAAEVPLVVPGERSGAGAGHGRAGQPGAGPQRAGPGAAAADPRLPGMAGSAGAGSPEDAEVARYSPTGEHALETAVVAARLDRAIDLLRDNGIAREAFRFANQAMALQRVRSELVRARLADPSAESPGCSGSWTSGNRSWRPFQLAFVLLCLPGLTSPVASGCAPRPCRRPGPAAVLSDRRRQDRGLPRAVRVHVRDPPAAGPVGGASPGRQPRRGGADALHPAAADRPAVSAGRRAGMRM